jgi:hypothetical protein
MRILSILLFFTISISSQSISNDFLEKEFEIRYNDKKNRSVMSSSLKDLYLAKPQKKTDSKFKRSRNFPLPPLPPIEGSDVPPPPGPAPTPTDDVPTVKDNTILDYNGKYTVHSENGDLIKVKFLEPVAIRINGYVLQLEPNQKSKYHATFARDGKLISNYSTLYQSIDAKVGPYNVEISDWVSFNDAGNITFLCPAGNEKKFQIGQNTITYHSTTKDHYLQKVFFYYDGSISSIHIRDPHQLKVGKYTIGFDHHEGCGGDLDFYANGSLKGGYLEKDTTIENVNYPKGTYLGFTESGILEKVYSRGNLTIQGIPISGIDRYWSEVEFHSNGKIKIARGLGRNITIDGKQYSKGKILMFDENGKVISSDY